MNPFHTTYFFKVSKATGIIEDVVYIPAYMAEDSDKTMYLVADEYTIFDYKKLIDKGPVNINDVIPGSFTKKKTR
ncbi:hypothetical protein D9M72_154890 [compost metagenome]